MWFLCISFGASIIGVICGIGGGVIIKPLLDMLQMESVAAINFLSGCTVLSMSCYSVGKSMYSKERAVKKEIGLPLAIGAMIGGVSGKQIFTIIKSAVGNYNKVSFIQAICLGVVTAGTLLYILNKDKVRTYNNQNIVISILIGVILGIMSSFLGIGGGPINLVVLYFFFSMDTKTAAANSLYIILFSQIASLMTSLVTHTVPEFKMSALIMMIIGGISGGIVGRQLTKRMDNKYVDKLLIILMILIIGICGYNAWSNMA